MDENPYQPPRTAGATRRLPVPVRDIVRLALGFIGLAFGAASVLCLVIWAVFNDTTLLASGIALGLIAIAQIGVAGRIK